MTKIPKQSHIGIPLRRGGFGLVPKVGGFGSVRGADVTGNSFLGVVNPHALLHNSTVTGRVRSASGVLGNPQVVGIAPLVARASQDDFDALYELAVLSDGGNDPERIRSAWSQDFCDHDEIRSFRSYIDSDPWQFTPSRRALKDAAYAFLERNHGNVEVLRSLHNWQDMKLEDADIMDSEYNRIDHRISLIGMAFAEVGAMNDDAYRALGVLYAMGDTSFIGYYFGHVLVARKEGIDMHSPRWWMEACRGVEAHVTSTFRQGEADIVEEMMRAATSVGEIAYAKKLAWYLEISSRAPLDFELEVMRRVQDKLLDVMIDHPDMFGDVWDIYTEEFDQTLFNFVHDLKKRSDARLPHAVSSIAVLARTEPDLFEMLIHFTRTVVSSLGSEEAWEALEQFDVETLVSLIELDPFLYSHLADIVEENELERGPFIDALNALEYMRLPAHPFTIDVLAGAGHQAAKRAQDARLKLEGRDENGVATVLNFPGGTVEDTSDLPPTAPTDGDPE